MKMDKIISAIKIGNYRKNKPLIPKGREDRVPNFLLREFP